MSAETLRQAASLLRDRAEAATPVQVEGGYEAYVLGSEGYAVLGRPREGRIGRTWVARCGMNDWETDRRNAEYIATMHPGVALAFADWLQAVVDRHDAITDTFAPGSQVGQIAANENVTGWAEALAVARQILGEVTP